MRATPLTILSPIPWWWELWIRATWPVADRSRFLKRKLLSLSFIHFARWGLIPRWPKDRQSRRDRAAPRALLFLTSFDGSDVQYIEAFVRVVPWQIRGLYLGATAFPGAGRFEPVARYIREHSHPVDHFWMAHPEVATTMVQQALDLRAVYEEFKPRLDAAGPDRFGEEWRRFLTVAQELL